MPYSGEPFTAYHANVPAYHPPYEDPIDFRYCLHFDEGVEFGMYHLTVDQSDDRKLGITSEIEEKLYGLTFSRTPSPGYDVELRTCIPSAARATTGPNMEPEESPALFCIYMLKSESHRWAEIYDPIKDLLEVEFPQSIHPECYSNGQLVIRFFAQEADRGYASHAGPSSTPKVATSAAHQLITPPVIPTAMPRTIEAVYGSDHILPPVIVAAMSKEPYREYFCPKGELFGASLAVFGQRGVFPAGTLGFFVHLQETGTGKLIKDVNGNVQVFGVTCAHVVQTEIVTLLPSQLQASPVYLANLSRRDRENTYFSHIDRKKTMYEEIQLLKAKAGQYVPGQDSFESLSEEKKSSVKSAYYIRENLKQQITKDAKLGHEKVSERNIGSLYLSGGRRTVTYEDELEGFTCPPTDRNVMSDFALIAMDPKYYPECNNQSSDSKFPICHPAAADIARSHRTLTAIKSLKPGMIVMKSGRCSGVTFGKIEQSRSIFKRAVLDPSSQKYLPPTMECLATPLQPLAFCQEGDSGAAVMDVSDGSLVGMVMGGRPSDTSKNYVTPIQIIQAELAQHFGLSMELYMGHHNDLTDIHATVLDESVATATSNAISGGPWENGDRGTILSCGIDKDGELCFVVMVEGSQQKFQVPRSILDKSWQGAVTTWDARVKAATARSPLKRPQRSNYNSPGLSPAEAKKKRIGGLVDRTTNW